MDTSTFKDRTGRLIAVSNRLRDVNDEERIGTVREMHGQWQLVIPGEPVQNVDDLDLDSWEIVG